MLRAFKIGAIVAIANVIGVQPAGAGTMTWGIFRENAVDIAESQRNCWVQAMVSGQTINGEVMAQNLSQQRAEFELQGLARRGLCAAERTSTSWSARGHGRGSFGESEHGRGRSSNNANDDESDWSNAGRSDGDFEPPHAGRTGRR